MEKDKDLSLGGNEESTILSTALATSSSAPFFFTRSEGAAGPVAALMASASTNISTASSLAEMAVVAGNTKMTFFCPDACPELAPPSVAVSANPPCATSTATTMKVLMTLPKDDDGTVKNLVPLEVEYTGTLVNRLIVQ
jgi:hypothetical protein